MSAQAPKWSSQQSSKRMQLVSQKQSRYCVALVSVGCSSHGIPISISPGWQPKHSILTPSQQPEIEQRDSPSLAGFSNWNFDIAFLPRYWSTSFRDSFAFYNDEWLISNCKISKPKFNWFSWPRWSASSYVHQTISWRDRINHDINHSHELFLCKIN